MVYLKEIELFHNLSDEEIQSVIHYIGTKERNVEKQEILFEEGESVSSIGIVLEGSLLIENTDYYGNRRIIHKVGPKGIFLEAYALSHKPLINSVVASEKTRVILLPIELFLSSSIGSYQGKLIENLLRISANKNISLSERIAHCHPKHIRERLLSYFRALVIQNKKNTIILPFNRNELAAYLEVDRSAMSKELSRMREDGMIQVNKREITVYSLK